VAGQHQAALRGPATASVAVGLGGLGACLYLALLFGNPGALILVYMTQLPLFVAGLWLGTGAAALAGLSGTVVLVAASDLITAAVFATLNAVPVVLLVRQALLARRRGDDTLRWYPPGLLAAWLTAFALAGMAAALLLFGGPQGLHAELRGVAAQALARLGRQPLPNVDRAADAIARIIPGIIAASWMVMAVVNGTLAQGVLARFGANWRPSPSVAALGLPWWIPAALGLAAAATLFGGAARFIGINVMIALSVPFCLAGLAVLHAAVRRLPSPAMALAGFYTLATLLGWPFLAVALLGLFESWLGLRHRLLPHGAQIDG
jgi:Predicted membrane protein (DUF2232)